MSEPNYLDTNYRRDFYLPGWRVLDVPTGRLGTVKRRWTKYGVVRYEVEFGPGLIAHRVHDQLLMATRAQAR